MSTMATTSLPPPALVARVSRLVGKAPWGVADQMLISASNMLVIVLLAWGLTQDDMGGYVLVSTILLLFNSVQDGLITQPHNVIGPRLEGEAYRRYSASTAAAHFALAAGFAALTIVAWAVAAWYAWWPAPLLLALAPATLAWQTQELARRILYTEGRVAAAFVNDAIAYGGQAAAVALLWWFGLLTGPGALYAIAIASGVAAVVGLWRIRDTLRAAPSLREVLHNWRVGKWLAGGELVGVWLGDGTLFYVAALVIGKEAAAILTVIQRIFGPTRILAMALHTMLPISMARRLAHGGPADLRTQVRGTLLTAMPVFAGFCLVMAVFARPILAVVFGEDYAASAHVLRVYALAMLLCYVGMVLNAALKAQHATRPLFMNRLVGSLVTLGLGAALLYAIGLSGVVLGMAAGYTVGAALNWAWLSRHHRIAAPAPSALAAPGSEVVA